MERERVELLIIKCLRKVLRTKKRLTKGFHKVQVDGVRRVGRPGKR